MKKTFLALCIASVLVLSSCGPAGNADTTEKTAPTAADQTDESLNTETPTKEQRYIGEQVEVDFATVAQIDHYYLSSKIAQFEEKYPHIKVVQNPSYSKDNPSLFADQVKTVLMAGNPPDIIKDHSWLLYQQRDNGLFTDFYGLMESDSGFNMDDYYTNVFEAYETGGALYSFPVSFAYDIAMINDNMPKNIVDQYKKMDTVSVMGMIRLFNEAGTDYKIEECFGVYVRTFLTREAARFIDYDRKECFLDSEAFIDILTAYKSAFFGFRGGNTGVSGGFGPYLFLANKHPEYRFDLLNAFHMSTVLYEIQYLYNFEKDPFVHAAPLVGPDGKLEPRASLARTDISYLIPAGAKHKEEAWEFIKFLAGDEFSVSGEISGKILQFEDNIPINKHLFKTVFMAKANRFMDALADDPDYAQYLGGIDAVLKDREANIQKAYEIYDRWNNMPMMPRHYDEEINITVDIFTSFLEGNITAEAAAAELQNKMRLKLNE